MRAHGATTKKSPVSREGIGTSMVVRGKREGGGADRDWNNEHQG